MKPYFLVGLTLLLATNILILSGVGYNRVGVPTSQLTLSERELRIDSNYTIDRESSGIDLTLNWRQSTPKNATYRPYRYGNISITEAQFSQLGFSPKDHMASYWRPSIEVYWALEFNGPSYRAELELAKQIADEKQANYTSNPNKHNERELEEANDHLTDEINHNSRLFFLEASAYRDQLFTKYADQDMVLIIKGLVRASYDQKQNQYFMHLVQPSVQSIMLPSEFKAHFESLTIDEMKKHQYEAEVHWGQRLEPWIVGFK